MDIWGEVSIGRKTQTHFDFKFFRGISADLQTGVAGWRDGLGPKFDPVDHMAAN